MWDDESKPKPKCEVCNANDMIGVACIPMTPVSVGYCRSCLQANAHPWWAMVTNTACTGGYDKTNEMWRLMIDDTIKHLGKTRKEFDKEVEEEIQAQAVRYHEMGEDNRRIAEHAMGMDCDEDTPLDDDMPTPGWDDEEEEDVS